MTIEAPVSKSKRNTLFIIMAVAIGFGLWCIYDGYFNQAFIDKGTNQETGEIDSTLKFNRQAPPFLFLAAGLAGAYAFLIRNRKMVATDTDLVVSKNLSIAYDSIQKIDKTYFKDKGYFDVYHTGSNGKETKTRIDDRKFDNLQPILDHLVAQIT